MAALEARRHDDGFMNLEGPLSLRRRITCTDSCTNSNPSSWSSSPIQALNDELLTEIILRVDHIKCTFRCKCVCKRWLYLINPNPLFPKSDPYFIRRYLSRRPDPAPMYCLLHSFASQSHPLQITTMRNARGWSFSLSFLPCPDPSQINILSSINGLILCCPGIHDHSAYFICNPVTKQWISLPPPPLCSERARLEKDRILAGFTFEGEDGINAGGRFRVVCFPSRNESFELAVEVFSSETGQWATCSVQRTPVCGPSPFLRVVDVSGPSSFGRVVVCNGILYWFEFCMFTAFNPWDNSFRFIPAPYSPTGPVGFLGASQGSLRAVILRHRLDSEGPSYEVHALKDCKSNEWFLEHLLQLRELKSTSNWLSSYALKSAARKTVPLAFHPNDGDVMFLRCKGRVVECNMQSREWKKIDKVFDRTIPFWQHRVVPLMLPWWPTPVPMLPQNQAV